MDIRVIKEKISQDELKKIAQESFGEMVKAVVDIEQEIIALGGELHADQEVLLIEKEGAKRENLWGINIYPGKPRQQWIAFSALINIHPSLGHRSMEIQDPKIKEKIKKIVEKLIQ